MESIVDNSIWLSTIYINKYNYSKTYQMLGHCCVVAAIFLLSLVVFPRILDVAWADSMPENWSHPQKCSDCAYSLCFSCSSFICFSQTWITIWQSNMAIWTIWTIINGVLMETSWIFQPFPVWFAGEFVTIGKHGCSIPIPWVNLPSLMLDIAWSKGIPPKNVWLVTFPQALHLAQMYPEIS